MSDPPEHEPDPAEPVSDSAADATPEADVERVLAEAAAYGDELSEEIGQAATSSTTHLDLDPVTAGTQGMNAEQELDRLEGLLAEVAEEGPAEPAGRGSVSGTAEESTEEAEDSATWDPAPDDQDATAGGSAVGDSEAAPPPAVSDDATIAARDAGEEIVPQAPDGLDAESMAELDRGLSTSGHEHTADNVSPLGDSSSEVERQDLVQDGGPSRSSRKRVGWREVMATCRTVTNGGVEIVLNGLDRFDRMFVRVSADLRRIIGWVALVITILAVAVLIHSFS